MAASASGGRRRRFVPAPASQPTGLGGQHMLALGLVGQAGIISLPQLARALDISAKKARRIMRALFDAGLVTLVAVTRAAFVDLGTRPDPQLALGSAPNVYVLSRTGARLLAKQDGASSPAADPPTGSVYIAHELAVTDALIWLLRLPKGTTAELLRWHRGGEAIFDLGRSQPPLTARPDAWFVCRLGERFLVGLVEADQGSERGLVRWSQKLAAYRLLFGSDVLKKTCGFSKARVLVLVPSARRRSSLAHLVYTEAEAPLAECFWFTERSALETGGLEAPIWERPGSPALVPLIPRLADAPPHG